VRFLACRRIRADELILARVGILWPVDRHVAARAVLIENARCDLEVIVRLPQCSQAQHRCVIAIRVRVDDRQRGWVDAVDPATVAPIPDTSAYAEGALDERHATGDAGLVAHRAALGIGGLGLRVDTALVEAGLHRDVADRATLRAGSEQRTL